MTPGAASRRRIATLADETHLPRVSGRADRKTSVAGESQSPTGKVGNEWRLDLPYPRPPLTLNQRMHWAPKLQIQRQIADDVTLLAHAAKLPTGLDRVEIVLCWHARLNRRRDTDNPAPTLKAAIDALTRYGLTADDDSEHVTSGVVIESGAPVDALWLSIRELRDGPEDR